MSDGRDNRLRIFITVGFDGSTRNVDGRRAVVGTEIRDIFFVVTEDEDGEGGDMGRAMNPDWTTLL